MQYRQTRIMNVRRRMLRRMKEADRIAVALLRGGTDDGDPDIRADFKLLRDRLRDSGLQILDPDAGIVGEDESQILGWLAAVQRQRLEPAIGNWRMATVEAQRCAEHLNHMGCRIDYHRVVTTQGADFSSRLAAAGWLEMSGPPERLDERSIVLRALEEKGAMRTMELTALGASRQALSVMVKHGLIRRLSYGVYACQPGPDDADS